MRHKKKGVLYEVVNALEGHRCISLFGASVTVFQFSIKGDAMAVSESKTKWQDLPKAMSAGEREKSGG